MKKILLIMIIFLLASCFVFSQSYLSQTAQAQEKPKYGGIFKFNYSRPASRFGVPWNIRAWNTEYARLALQMLMKRTNVQNVFAPELATSWELSHNKSYYIFRLKKGVKFHDGTDFNAHSVKWNIEKVLASTRPHFKTVTSIDVIDDYTIRFNISSWDALFLSNFNSSSGYIISPSSYEKHSERWADTHPIGTGAFKLKEFRRNVVVKYEKFNDYWEKGLPYLDEVYITQIPDPMTAIAVLKKGDLHCLYEVDIVTAKELKQTGKYNFESNEGLHQIIVMNSTDPNSVWSNKKMREALEYAINKERITKALGYGFFHAIYEVIYGVPGNPGTIPRKYDPQKARQLMREAGYPEGVKVKLTVLAEEQKDFYVALQSDLAEAGIQVEINPVKGSTLFQSVYATSPGSGLRVMAQTDGTNALSIAQNVLSSRSISFPDLKRPEGFDDLLNQALSEADRGKRVALLEKMERLANRDIMLVPIWNKPIVKIINPVVKDYIFSVGGGPHISLQNAWLDKK